MSFGKWRSFACSPRELDLSIVLQCGQSFRWKEFDESWFGVLHDKLWQLKQDNEKLLYRVIDSQKNGSEAETKAENTNTTQTISRKRRKIDQISPQKKSKIENVTESSTSGDVSVYFDLNNNKGSRRHDETILRDYFQLDNVDLGKLCANWSKIDSHFASIYSRIPGVRMLRQDPTENLFAFICSSNNNISRITTMVEKMCENFGEKIPSPDEHQYYTFPTVKRLAEPNTEEILRKLGFGYRAKYVHQTAKQVLKNGGEIWLHQLRERTYEDAHKELVKLPGIGAKVADCICMMSLDKSEAIPVDTHVWQIAVRDYNIPQLVNTKTLTAPGYKAIGDFFRDLWGPKSSWCMNFLFAADLRQFKHLKKDRK